MRNKYFKMDFKWWNVALHRAASIVHSAKWSSTCFRQEHHLVVSCTFLTCCLSIFSRRNAQCDCDANRLHRDFSVIKKMCVVAAVECALSRCKIYMCDACRSMWKSFGWQQFAVKKSNFKWLWWDAASKCAAIEWLACQIHSHSPHSPCVSIKIKSKVLFDSVNARRQF